MTQIDLTIAGVGGQGSILAGIILGTAAVNHDGKYAVQTQAYSSELRGGFAATWVIISDVPVDFPRVTEPDILVAQAQDSINRFAKGLKSGGLLIIDSDMIAQPPPDIERVVKVPATSIARRELGTPMVANIVMLGALWQATELVSREALKKAIAEAVPKGKEELNLVAFDKGVQATKSQLSSGATNNKE
ncbi:MAG: 2-oxoacid:acceptor oxidoreductase family protein [Desulfobacteraceae bacterium]|jgi:2-oxoglutarate ferredoxin oxidoreductase subunit gamma